MRTTTELGTIKAATYGKQGESRIGFAVTIESDKAGQWTSCHNYLLPAAMNKMLSHQGGKLETISAMLDAWAESKKNILTLMEKTLEEAGVDTIDQLAGKRVEVTLTNHDILVSWKIIKGEQA